MEKVAFVTGAGGYLGGDIARRFAKNGMKFDAVLNSSAAISPPMAAVFRLTAVVLAVIAVAPNKLMRVPMPEMT